MKKVCATCKKEKYIKSYWKSKQNKDGLRCSCIDCLKNVIC
jgi:hypothetical protein